MNYAAELVLTVVAAAIGIGIVLWIFLRHAD